MPDISRDRDSARKPLIRYEWLLACAVVLVLAAFTAMSTGASSRSGGRPAADHQSRHQASTTALFDGAGVSRSEAPVLGPAVPAGAVAPGVPAAAEHTMSMDAPIQGGLTAHEEQAISARLIDAHRDAATAPKSTYWTAAMGRSAVARAESWLGMPYSWAGGSSSGPTPGRCEIGTGGDLDCHVVGFDCSGLMMYAWGSYLSLPHLAATQRAAGAFHPTLEQLLPGDMVFFSGYIPGGIGHVAIYAGDGMVLEAPQSGSVIRRTALAEMMISDGVYRGAVRPLTAATPTLSAPHGTVAPAGGMITLRGAHLAGVDAVHVGGVTVQRFAHHSDTAITFRAPAHEAGRAAVSVTTSWHAQSRPVTLTYAEPKAASPAPATTAGSSTPPASTTSTPPASSTPPKSTAPSSSASKSTAPTKSTTPKSSESGELTDPTKSTTAPSSSAPPTSSADASDATAGSTHAITADDVTP